MQLRYPIGFLLDAYLARARHISLRFNVIHTPLCCFLNPFPFREAQGYRFKTFIFALTAIYCSIALPALVGVHGALDVLHPLSFGHIGNTQK